MTAEEPPKFITEAGVRKMNPAWKAWKAGGTAAPAPQTDGGAPQQQNVVSVAPPMRNEATSLAVVSNMHQFSQLGADAQTTNGFQVAAERLQTAAVAQQVGLSQDQMLAQLGIVFAKYEIPMGLLQKLLIVEKFQVMHACVDDSGSMGMRTDSKFPDGRQMTRWDEAYRLLSQMIEVLAYIPAPPFHVTFLNRSTHLVFQKTAGEAPQAFVQRATTTLRNEWTRGPDGSTPVLRALQKLFNEYPGQAAIRYLLCDGQPDESVEDISNLIKKRANPEKNPFTMFAMTDDDDAVGWMADVEEQALFCAALDDFNDESEEILKSQGKALPFSYGMYLVSCLVGALFEDLDGLDEDTPLTKPQMSEIVGYQLSDPEYDFYFQEFMAAQSRKPRPQSDEDKLKAEYAQKWPGLKEDFRKAIKAGDIPLVAEFRKKMLSAKDGGCVIA